MVTARDVRSAVVSKVGPAAGAVVTSAIPVPVVNALAGWAVTESINHLVARIDTNTNSTKPFEELLAMLRDPRLQAAVHALDQLTDTGQGFAAYRADYTEVCDALAHANFLIASKSAREAPRGRKGCVRAWQCVWGISHEQSEQARLCKQLQPYCTLPKYADLYNTLQSQSALHTAPPTIQENEPQPRLPQRGEVRLPNSSISTPPTEPQHLFQHDEDLVPEIDALLRSTRNIGIAGMGGIGKSTIAAAVFSTSSSEKSRFDAAVWLTVGKDATDMLPLLKSAYAQLFPGSSIPFTTADVGLTVLTQSVYQRSWKVLLVLDDVWDRQGPSVVAALNFATHPERKVDGSRLIVTTRDSSMISYNPPALLMDELQVIHMCGLDSEPAKQIFHHHAFREGTASVPAYVPEDAYSGMIGYCGGNPLALKVLGASVVDIKSKEGWLTRWEEVQNLQGPDTAKNVCASSVQFPRIPHSLRQCFLDFAAFPKGDMISEDSLVHLFATHAPLSSAFDDEAGSVIMHAATKKLEALEQRNLVSRNNRDDGKSHFYMHHILHDIALGMTREPGSKCCFHSRSFDAETKLSSVHRFSLHDPATLQAALPPEHGKGDQLVACIISHVLPGPATLHWQSLRRLRYLKIHGDLTQFGSALRASNLKLPMLNLLDVQQSTGAAAVLESVLGSAVRLMHLDTSDCVDLKSLPQNIGSCNQLKFLRISGCLNMQECPDWIGSCSELQHLDLRGCSALTAVPDSMGRLSNFTCLRLNGLKGLEQVLGDLLQLQHQLKYFRLVADQDLPQLPSSIKQCTALESLWLVHCTAMQRLPESIKYLSRLTYLSLKGCTGLQTLPHGIDHCRQLMGLNLRQCSSLTHLPASIGGCGQLTFLSLSGCEALVELPESIDRCSQLVALSLAQCKTLTHLPQSFGGFSHLKTLSLDGCEGVQELPESIGNCRQLVKLSLKQCKNLTHLPPSFGGCTQLTHLSLSGCGGLQQLLDSIGDCTQLRCFSLAQCKRITQLPSSIGRCSQLTFLSLSGCEGIQKLPESIGRCQRLMCVSLERCKTLTYMPWTFGGCSQLTVLSLEGCEGLQTLPASIGCCRQLVKLGLKRCKTLTHLPRSFCGCGQLTYLNLSGCEGLQELPDNLGRCSQLMCVSLERCKTLTHLPASFGGCSQLTRLNLSGCQGLEELPHTIGRCSLLRSLDLRHCVRLSHLPQSLTSWCRPRHLNLREHMPE